MFHMTDQERAMLDFERANSWWKYAGSKETAIRDLFGVSSTRYHQQLVRLLERPAAEEYDAFTARRLRAVSRRRLA
jgi:hypothetical protein